MGVTMPSSQLLPNPVAMSHFRCFNNEHCDFLEPAPGSGEAYIVQEALRTALLNTIPLTKGTLNRASKYHTLALVCSRLARKDEAVEYFLKAVEHLRPMYLQVRYQSGRGYARLPCFHVE